MSFLDLLDTLRSRPEAYRRRVAFLMTVVLTLAVVTTWSKLPERAPSAPPVASESAAAQTAATITGPLETLKNMGKTLYRDLRDFYDVLNNQ